MKTQAVSTWRERTGHGIVTRTRDAGMDRRWAEEKEEKKRKEKKKKNAKRRRKGQPLDSSPIDDRQLLFVLSLYLGGKINRTSVRNKWGEP